MNDQCLITLDKLKRPAKEGELFYHQLFMLAIKVTIFLHQLPTHASLRFVECELHLWSRKLGTMVRTPLSKFKELKKCSLCSCF